MADGEVIEKKQFPYGTTLLIGVPTLGTISMWWHLNMMNLFSTDMPVNTTHFQYSVFGKKVSEARQELVEMAFELDAKYILFVDDDTIIPVGTIKKLMSHDKDVCIGFYFTKSDILPEPLIFKARDSGAWFNYPRNELVKVWGGGLGCALIKTDVFRKLRDAGVKNFFQDYETFTRSDGSEARGYGTEDIGFYKACEENGIEVYCDTSIKCQHVSIAKNKVYPDPDGEQWRNA